ncbi:hypothetical protein BgAZ_404770 [Babesia gibsoni]|uniref:Cytochrome b5 heme-binding domain-containing protein n=1 Tax=Babesia gibsoni TaxID=33632 RepID=A0AAD8LIY6_BABGI|nr:hypothetical protein BgAZ_404770 [Babesia gibsoni]
MMDMNKDAVVTRVSHYLDAAEVALHNSPDDCWCIYNGKVYDITRYLDMHPGGRDHLLEYAGKDVTEEFYGVHPWVNAEILLKSLFVGEIKPQVHGEIIAASDNDRGEE